MLYFIAQIFYRFTDKLLCLSIESRNISTEILSDVYKYKGKLTTDTALLSGSLAIKTLGIHKVFLMRPGFVHQSSIGDALKKSGINEITKMDKRVFARVKNSKNLKSLFLNDARKSIDRNLVKHVKFDTKRLKMPRLPASLKKMKLNKKIKFDKKSTTKDTKAYFKKKSQKMKIPSAVKAFDFFK